MKSSSTLAGIDTGRTKYHLRRLNYLNNLKWDEETEYLAVYVNGQEVEFDLWSNGSIIHLINQPDVGARIDMIVEDIVFLDD